MSNIIGQTITIEYCNGSFDKREDDVVTGVVLAILPMGYRIKPIDSNRPLDIENGNYDDGWMRIQSVKIS
jgi:hypothetical protein